MIALLHIVERERERETERDRETKRDQVGYSDLLSCVAMAP